MTGSVTIGVGSTVIMSVGASTGISVSVGVGAGAPSAVWDTPTVSRAGTGGKAKRDDGNLGALGFLLNSSSDVLLKFSKSHFIAGNIGRCTR